MSKLCHFFQIFDLCILYAPYRRNFSLELNQTLQEGSIYSEVVQRRVDFQFIQEIVNIMSIFQIFYLCILYSP